MCPRFHGNIGAQTWLGEWPPGLVAGKDIRILLDPILPFVSQEKYVSGMYQKRRRSYTFAQLLDLQVGPRGLEPRTK